MIQRPSWRLAKLVSGGNSSFLDSLKYFNNIIPILDKSKASQLSEGGKKPADGSLGGYMYPFYPHQSPYFPPDPGKF